MVFGIALDMAAAGVEDASDDVASIQSRSADTERLRLFSNQRKLRKVYIPVAAGVAPARSQGFGGDAIVVVVNSLRLLEQRVSGGVATHDDAGGRFLGGDASGSRVGGRGSLGETPNKWSVSINVVGLGWLAATGKQWWENKEMGAKTIGIDDGTKVGRFS